MCSLYRIHIIRAYFISIFNYIFIHVVFIFNDTTNFKAGCKRPWSLFYGQMAVSISSYIRVFLNICAFSWTAVFGIILIDLSIPTSAWYEIILRLVLPRVLITFSLTPHSHLSSNTRSLDLSIFFSSFLQTRTSPYITLHHLTSPYITLHHLE